MSFNIDESAKSIILVVDDDKEIANSVAKILEKEGYICKIANDGFSALEIVMEQQIIIKFLQLPTFVKSVECV